MVDKLKLTSKNVCVVNPNYFRSSGVTIAIKRIHEAVSIYGIENYFVDCGYGNTPQDILWIPEGKLVKFNLMTRNPLRLLSEIFRFYSWAKRKNIGLIHVHHRRFIILSMLSYFFDGTLLYSANLSYKFSFWFWLFSPKHVIAVTKSIEENVQKTIRAHYIDIIGNPTEFPLCYPSNEFLADPRKAVCVARLEPVKGHRYLIEAWNLLAQKGLRYKLLLVGEGGLQEQLHDLVRELGLDSLVSFHGYTADVSALYERCLFSILVSEIEGQGIVTIEAAAAGRASLLTDVDGSRDCLPPNRVLSNGLSFGDVEALSGAIEYWFSNPKAAIDEGRIFFDFHKEINSFKAIGEKYANVYKSLISKIPNNN